MPLDVELQDSPLHSKDHPRDPSAEASAVAAQELSTLSNNTLAGRVTPKDPDAEFSWSNRGIRFWMLVSATLTVDFLSAFELSAVSTTLPTIVSDIHGSDFIWAGSAYPLAATALIPLCGGLVSIFGRKPILLLCIIFFAVGSAVSGAAHSLNMLIAGRAIQGLGSGGCLATTEIIYADLVPLPQRGVIQGITAVMWGTSSVVGPVVGGALAHSGAWRWLFYLNIPISAIAFCLIVLFYSVESPRASFRFMMKRIDWIGGIFVVGASTSLTLALTWGGTQFEWNAPQTLAPLIIGAVAFVCFFFVERFVSVEPIIPWNIVSNRTSLSGYIGTGVHGLLSFAALYYLPVYFQAVLCESPISSGLDLLGLLAFVTPSCMAVGVSVAIFRLYRPQNYIGWCFIIAGFATLTILDVHSSKARAVCCQFVVAIGIGIVWISTQFPILAPLPQSNNAHALAFFTFVRFMTQTLGIAIGGAVLQNQLQSHLPAFYLATIPDQLSIAYSIIPGILGLAEPLQTDVRTAFAESLKIVWVTMTGISVLGLLSCLLMKEVDMHADVDERWTPRQAESSHI